MNKTFRFFFAAALALSPFAPASASAGTADDAIRGPYEPTRFGDNTFIDVQGGVNAFGASNMTRGDVWSSVRPSAAPGVSFGKWFVPSVGLRVGWQGLMSDWAPGQDFTPALPRMRGWYNYAHADLLVDCCNWFGGYRRERTWSVIPYLSAGAAWNYIVPVDGHDYNYAFITDENPVRTAYSGICSVAFGAGLYNRFRISDRFGITLDVRAVAHDRDLLGEAVNYGIDGSGFPVIDGYKARGMEIFGGNLSAMVGVCIGLGSVGWKHRSGSDDASSSSVRDFAAVPVRPAMPGQPASGALVDSAGNVLPACYPGLAPGVADAYCALANSPGRPDFTTMSKRKAGAWTRSHGDILPDGWKMMTPGERNAWLSATVYVPAGRARKDRAAAEELPARAVETGDVPGKATAEDSNRRPADTKARRFSDLVRESSEGEDKLAFAFLFVPKDTMNLAQILELEQDISGLDRSADYDIIGYALIRPVAKDTLKSAEEVKPEQIPSKSGTKDLFGWQIMSGKAKIPSNDRRFLGYEPMVVEAGDGMLKYIIGVSDSPAGAYANKVEIKGKYPDAFLVRISNGVSHYQYKPEEGPK